MVVLEIILWAALAYIVLVLLIEGVVWRFQPPMDGALTLIIRPDDADSIERKLDTFEHEGSLYVASNHWFRSWYHAMLADPEVEVIRDGVSRRHRAEAVSGEAHAALSRAYPMGPPQVPVWVCAQPFRSPGARI